MTEGGRLPDDVEPPSPCEWTPPILLPGGRRSAPVPVNPSAVVGELEHSLQLFHPGYPQLCIHILGGVELYCLLVGKDLLCLPVGRD